MNDSFYAIEVMMRQRQRDILRDADLRRMARMASGAEGRTRPPRSFGTALAPVLAGAGSLLVAAGRGLESRAARWSIRRGSPACVECLPPSPAA